MKTSGSSWREEPGKLDDSSLRSRLKEMKERAACFPAVREIIMQKTMLKEVRGDDKKKKT